MNLPTRIGLRAGDVVCLFTIELEFLFSPSVGNFVVFDVSIDHVKTIETKITHICHYFPNNDAIIILDYVTCEKYDDMLLVLDWFKSHYTLVDVVSENDPQPYYIFYRLVLQLLGRSKESNSLLNNDANSIKIFAEACRSIMIAQFYGDEEYGSIHLSNTNQAIVDLYSLIFVEKDRNDQIKIINVIKSWERRLNEHCDIKWDVSIEQCRRAAKFVFGKLKSIPSNMLPDFGDD